MIIICTENPDFSDIPIQYCDWDYFIYGNIKEVNHSDIPESLDNRVTVTTYVDKNLYHGILTGSSAPGILYLVDKIPT